MRMRFGVRRRVVLAAVFVLINGTIATAITVNVLLTDRLTRDADAVLRARADAQLATVELVDGRVIVREGTSDESLDREAWVFVDGRAIAKPPAGSELQQAAAGLSGSRARRLQSGPGEVRFLAEPARTVDGRQFATVVVGIDLTPYEDTERFARWGSLLIGLLVVLAGGVVASRSVAAGLRPVREMALLAEGYGDHDLSKRFGMGPPHDELTTLAATLDGLLGRLEASVRREERLTAEIAHELRTPLSGLRASAELGLMEQTPNAMRKALETVTASADRLADVINSLLAAARTHSQRESVCMLDDAVQEAVSDVAELARGGGVAIAITGTGSQAQIGADVAIVRQAMMPLLENAIRHATSKIAVTVTVNAGTANARVVIDDDGAGVANEDRDAIFEPGWHRPGGSGSGAGLGLALARRLAHALGGHVDVEAPESGARFVLELPLIATR